VQQAAAVQRCCKQGSGSLLSLKLFPEGQYFGSLFLAAQRAGAWLPALPYFAVPHVAESVTCIDFPQGREPATS